MGNSATEIPLSTPLKRLGRHTLLVLEDRHAVLRHEGSALRLHVVGEETTTIRAKPENRAVGDVVLIATQLRPLRAFALPDGELARSWLGPRDFLRFQTSGVVGVLISGLFLAMLHSSGDLLRELGAPAVLLFLLLYAVLLVSIRVVCQRHGWVHVVDGRRWRLADLVVGSDPAEIATQQVDEVKEEYGRLCTDLPYRIEHPALFDAAHPTTEELTLALFQWDSEQARLDVDDRAELASRVVRAFHTARRHAERVKLGHLPQATRGEAGRALRAARIAVEPAASRAERAAALEVAVQILDDLALYHLPSVAEARDAVGRRRLKQLPGRREP